MYERLLDKQARPDEEALAAFCGDGGWIQLRVQSDELLRDAQTLLAVKCGNRAP